MLAGAALALRGAAAPLAAQSQATTGIIRGVVSDPTGSPVANAQVFLHETQTNFTRTLTTDAAGNFTGTLLPLGTYEATARAVGFAESKRTGIPLGVGETVDLRLQLAAVTLAPVTVEATRPVVEVTKAEASTPLAAQVVSGLPNNGRNFINLTLLTPNVAIVQGPDGDELTVAGQRGIHNNVSVDGADFNNSFFGEQRGGQRPAFTFNLDAVQEVVVVEGPANAEFGRASAGFVNVITKSGTNETKGSLHYFGKFDAVSGSPEHTFPSVAIPSSRTTLARFPAPTMRGRRSPSSTSVFRTGTTCRSSTTTRGPSRRTARSTSTRGVRVRTAWKRTGPML